MLKSIGLDELLSLQGDCVVLMPNDAAARQCRDALATLRGGHDQAFLETISVMPADQWLAELWDSSFPDKQVLRPIQLLALARKIIEDSEYFPANCLNPLAITRQFVDAFQLHAEYQLETRREDYLFSPEFQGFYHWRIALQQQLDQQQALSSQQLPAHLLALLGDGRLPLPDYVICSEQLQLSPAMAEFVTVCQQQSQGLQLRSVEAAPSPDVKLLVSQQLQQECEAVAQWLVELLPTLPQAASVAIVVPDMTRYQHALNSALSRQLHPASLFPKLAPSSAEPWLFEGSEKILSFPLIRAAWDVISLNTNKLETEHLSRILRSRFVRGWPEKRSERASLDLRWRERMGPESSLKSALSLSTKIIAEDPEILAPLQELDELISAAPNRQLPSVWVRFFDNLLLCSGWPNADDNDLVVMQCRRGFSQAMDVFRALDRQLGPINHGDALSWLQHILSTKRFSITRDCHCPVRVMSYDDAFGRQFDATWIMGLDDSALPRRAEPSAFLPLHLQKNSGIPDSQPELMLKRDQRLLDALLLSAPIVYVSYCRQNEAGSPLALSSLLNEFSEHKFSEIALSYTCSADLIKTQNDDVNSVDVEERKKLKGGTGLFKEYASSPFFAFLKYRLNLKEFPASEEGLDHRVQGILVHDSLQYFWEEVVDSKTLLAMTDAQFTEMVSRCVQKAFTHPELKSSRYGEALKGLEKRRLISLLSAWLHEKEKQRIEAFEVVATEQERECEFMGIPLRLRIDRIDRVGEHTLLIDYKTGQVQGKALNVDEMTEPQLPIYALVEAEAGRGVDGVMLAQVKSPEDLAIHMRSNWANSVIPKRASKNTDVDSSDKWDAEMAAWQKALSAMAQGILGGNIAHDFSRNHSRGFSSFLLPLLRGEDQHGEAEE